MRICFVTPEYVTEEQNYDGGLSNYLDRISSSLRDLGHDPVIVVASRLKGRLYHKGIEVNRVKAAWYNGNIMRFVKYVPGLDWKLVSWQLNRAVRHLNDEKPLDIVQYSSVGATVLARHQEIPSVVRISGNQKLWDLAYEEETTKARKIYQDLEIEALRKADSIFGPSSVIANFLKRDYGFSVKVIESPFVQQADSVSLETSKKINAQLAGKEYLLFFGSLGLAKGVKTIADAAYQILEAYPEIGIVLVGKDLGYSGQPMMRYLKQKAGEHAGRVIWHDRVRHDQLYPVIQGAKLVMLPSRIDNFPNCCIEAMAFRKVVIGTRGASFEQLIGDGVSGLLCEADSPGDLFAVVAKALNADAKDLSEMGERAFERTLTLSPEITARKLVEYYTAVKSRADAPSRT